MLDSAEIDGTRYICDGADGSPGQAGSAGSSGLNSLVTLSAAPSGTDCPNGGQRVESGLDADRDGQLDQSEISSTGYVCNGAASP